MTVLCLQNFSPHNQTLLEILVRNFHELIQQTEKQPQQFRIVNLSKKDDCATPFAAIMEKIMEVH